MIYKDPIEKEASSFADFKMWLSRNINKNLTWFNL